ncbi:MAG: thermonuclease family protein [Candidatus Omnitrophica bacterium]|jgi:micrococcal nuclease|nr:thermonuclease family protein [Candidatus Omnitrophota bacterium]
MKNLPWFILGLFGLVFLLGASSCVKDPVDVQYSSESGVFSVPFGDSYNYTDIRVTRAVDGDTLLLESGERVRLIGIDTPEMHESKKLYKDAERAKEDISTIQKLGRRSYEFTKNLVEGKRVSLEFDAERYDRYKRLLAYVYLKDGTFVNAEIVKQGYASLMTFPPNVKYADLFLKLYQEARQERRGLWK